MVNLAARHHSHDQERLGAEGDQVRQCGLRRLTGQFLITGESLRSLAEGKRILHLQYSDTEAKPGETAQTIFTDPARCVP